MKHIKLFIVQVKFLLESQKCIFPLKILYEAM